MIKNPQPKKEEEEKKKENTYEWFLVVVVVVEKNIEKEWVRKRRNGECKGNTNSMP